MPDRAIQSIGRRMGNGTWLAIIATGLIGCVDNSAAFQMRKACFDHQEHDGGGW